MPAKPTIRTFGDKVVGIEIKGNPKHPEFETYRITFPGCTVDVTRAEDNKPDPDYWVHVVVNNPKAPWFSDDSMDPAQFVDARLHQADKHTVDADVGDFGSAALYDVALRVQAIKKTN